MKLSILIVSYNVRDLLERCLRSLERVPDDWEVIIVDNDSHDGTKKYLDRLKVEGGRWKVVLLPKNVGFAKGNIEAYKHAKGEYILLLNPDTKVLPNSIETMIRYLAEHPSVSILGPKLLNEDGSIQRSVRGFPTLWSQIFVLLKLHNYLCKSSSNVIPDLDPESKQQKAKSKQTSVFSFLIFLSGSRTKLRDDKRRCFTSLENYLLPNFDYSKAQSVDQIMGAALMTRRSAIELVGFLDPGYKRIFEEVDFCYRVKKHGGEVAYLPEARIVHSKGASFNSSVIPGFDPESKQQTINNKQNSIFSFLFFLFGSRVRARDDKSGLWRMLVKQFYFNQGMFRFFWKHKPLWQTIALIPFFILSLSITIMLWTMLRVNVPLSKNREW